MKLKLLISALFACSISFGQVVDGLFAEYLFNDGTANATVGSDDGIMSNVALCPDRFGCPEHALAFNGTEESFVDFDDSFDDYMALPDSSYSISIWFKMANTTEFDEIMFAKYSHGFCSENQQEYVLRKSATGTIEFGTWFGLTWANNVRVGSTTVIDDTLWHHVVIIYDGSINTSGGFDRFQMYLDNVPEVLTLIGTAGSLGDVNNGSAHSALGMTLNSVGTPCENPSIEQWFDGCLDDLRLYDRKLNSVEVDELFNEDSECSDPVTSIEPSINICENDSVLIFGDYVSVAGLYYDSLMTVAGCDSIIEQELIVTSSDIDTTISVVSGGVLSSNHSGASYQWIHCLTGAPIPGATDQEYTPLDDGEYAVVITDGPCSDTSECVRVFAQGLDEQQLELGSFFPNPADDYVIIPLPHTEQSFTISVWDQLGRIITTSIVEGNEYNMNTHELPNGVYLVRISDGIRTEYNKRLVIQH